MDAGFEEVNHTADWQIRVWSASFPGLLETAALGMYYLMGIEQAQNSPIDVDFIMIGEDAESQLVEFLNELLYLVESEKARFTQFSFEKRVPGWICHMSGNRIISITRDIKAVTFHNLQVSLGEMGYEVNIVFDV